MFGKDASSWIDDRTKGSMQNDENVSHWDCKPDTKEKWMKDFLRWRHRQKGRLSPESQVEVLPSVLDDKNFKEANESQLEDEEVEDDFGAASQIVTGSVLPHEYKPRAEFKGFVIDTSKDMTAEVWVIFWADFQRHGAKIKGGRTQKLAKEHLMEHIYHYDEQRPKEKLLERMQREMNEDEEAYCPFSYIELFAWICGQLVICNHAKESPPASFDLWAAATLADQSDSDTRGAWFSGVRGRHLAFVQIVRPVGHVRAAIARTCPRTCISSADYSAKTPEGGPTW